MQAAVSPPLSYSVHSSHGMRKVTSLKFNRNERRHCCIILLSLWGNYSQNCSRLASLQNRTTLWGEKLRSSLERVSQGVKSAWVVGAHLYSAPMIKAGKSWCHMFALSCLSVTCRPVKKGLSLCEITGKKMSRTTLFCCSVTGQIVASSLQKSAVTVTLFYDFKLLYHLN